MSEKNFRPDRIASYFISEWKTLAIVSVTGVIYNVGLLAAPWFEGQLAGTLAEILGGRSDFSEMLHLAVGYISAIVLVQGVRCVKRFSVRRFANNVNRRMKKILYASLLRTRRAEPERADVGSVLTKAIADVDDCAEGMRKFTTEIFDTGVAMIGYFSMLLASDWRLALMTAVFPPAAYFLAEKMKVCVQQAGTAAKKEAGRLNAATLDRAANALTYRVFGCEEQRRRDYERQLTDYETAAVRANFRTNALPPLYRVICMAGTALILYFGGKNVLAQGWQVWDVAAFAAFLSCYTKLSVKSSRAAKLFNAVHKAQISWRRIQPLLEAEKPCEPPAVCPAADLAVENLSFAHPSGQKVFENVCFFAKPGQIIGITGPVACGKSTLGRLFLGEENYEGSIRFGGRALRELPQARQRGIVGYLGHDPELFSDTLRNNILLGEEGDILPVLRAVCMDEEVGRMENGADTVVGAQGVRLSGGQAQRLGLARTLFRRRPLLVLDDPFSALDRDTERAAFEHLRAWAKDGIVLLISHRLTLFPQMDGVVWLNRGRAETGTHEEMMKKQPMYAELFRAEEGGGNDEA